MRAIAKVLALRLSSAIVTLSGVALLIFLAIHALPGSYEEVMTPQGPPELREQIRERLGLDRPLHEQFLTWIGAAATGDFGNSLVTQQPVWREFAERIPITAEIALGSTLLALVIGVPLGIAAGLAGRRRSVETGSRLIGAGAMSVPDFVIGSVLLFLISKYGLGMTTGAWVSWSEDPVAHLRALAPPCLALAPLGVGLIMATTRYALLAVASENYVMAMVARGKPTGQLVRQHVLRNISVPVVTVLAVYSGYLLGGAVLVELLFSIPGLGRYLVQAVLNRDYPIVQAGVLLSSAFFIALNVLADFAYILIDPRLARRGSAT